MTNLKNYIRDVVDFPKKGIVFKDITPLLQEKFPETIHQLVQLIAPYAHLFTSIAAIESRGFIFGAALAAKLDKGFITIRKKGKLPPPTQSMQYALEYGHDSLEISSFALSKNPREKILIVDDVLATGGTFQAVLKLCEITGLQVYGGLFLINLQTLNNLEEELTKPNFFMKSLFHF